MKKCRSRVINIRWERIYLYLTLELDPEISRNARFYLANANYRVEAEFDVIGRQDTTAELKLNVTNNGTNRCVDNGIYTLLTVDGDSYISEAGFDGSSHQLEDWGHCFRYMNNTGAYTVTFLLDEYAEESRFQLLFFNTVARNMANRVPMTAGPGPEPMPNTGFTARLQLKGKNLAAGIGARLRKGAFYHWYRQSRRNSHRKKNILFLSEQDDVLALNMQSLLDRMRQRGLDQQFDICFSLRKATSQQQTRSSNLKMLKKVAQADLIIVDDHVPLFNRMLLPKDIKMIQIWHAGAGFKGVGYSRWGHAGCPGPFSAHRQYDYCISGSSNISGFFSEQFGILDEQIIPTGMPRMDIYLNQENRQRITRELYESYPPLKGKKVVLFAPTYRGQNRATAYYPYEKIDFDRLYQLCIEKNMAVVFKMHPWVSQPVPIRPEHQDRFFDMNAYGNINELFYITDVLITDYSSSIYEFSLMDKPMLFFAYDKVQYSTSRGFHRDYDSTVPGRVCDSFAQVLEALEQENYDFEKVEKYRIEHFDFVDDHAADRIIDWLILDQLPERYTKPLAEKRQHIRNTRGLSFREYFPEAENNA